MKEFLKDFMTKIDDRRSNSWWNSCKNAGIPGRIPEGFFWLSALIFEELSADHVRMAERTLETIPRDISLSICNEIPVEILEEFLK